MAMPCMHCKMAVWLPACWAWPRLLLVQAVRQGKTHMLHIPRQMQLQTHTLYMKHARRKQTLNLLSITVLQILSNLCIPSKAHPRLCQRAVLPANLR